MPGHSAALISTEELARRMGAPALRVFDCTTYLRPRPEGGYNAESGRANYDTGHIPGAAFLDLAARRVFRASTEVHLTPNEYRLLTTLIRHAGKVCTHRQLLTEVWGPTYVNESHYLRQYLKHLRRKLEDDPARPRHLITEPGLGYRFQP